MAGDAWWKFGVIYQIYPRSFQDSNGDGIGDLNGVSLRLDYLQRLGVDALWLSPIFPSPMADFGYDVSDYCGVDARFGTLDDFDRLIQQVHSRGLKLILDFVPNHTSDRHPWFIESRRRDSPKRDWYLWRDPAPDGGPPNNWLSNFGGPGWTLDAASGQYYAHAFLKEQPDLNWRNPAVRAAMYDVLRFWLRRGVDGFRVDVIYHIIKDALFRDNPINPDYVEGDDPSHRFLPTHTTDQPEVQDIVVEMRRVLDEFGTEQSAKVLIGELYLPIEKLVAYYGADATGVLRGAQLPFNFHLIGTQWTAGSIDRLVRDYEAALPPGAAPNWVLGNHDKPRIATRLGERNARLAALLLLTLRGTPTLYYGDELGMQDVFIPQHEIQDPFEKNQPGKGLGRDPQRTPMAWDTSLNAGFSSGAPWLRLGEEASSVNVQCEMQDSTSVLQFYIRLLALRKNHPALNRGAYAPVLVKGNLLVYQRSYGEQRMLIALNFGDQAVTLAPSLISDTPEKLLSTTSAHLVRSDEQYQLPSDVSRQDGVYLLGPNEGVVFGN